VSGIIQIIQKNPQSGIYNFGSGKSTKVIDIVKTVEYAVLGTDIYYSRMLNSTSSTEYDFWADIAKSQIELNWTPTIELQEGIKKYINFIRNE
jgi:nucleoside-diphosphate-sugar epimerase